MTGEAEGTDLERAGASLDGERPTEHADTGDLGPFPGRKVGHSTLTQGAGAPQSRPSKVGATSLVDHEAGRSDRSGEAATVLGVSEDALPRPMGFGARAQPGPIFGGPAADASRFPAAGPVAASGSAGDPASAIVAAAPSGAVAASAPPPGPPAHAARASAPRPAGAPASPPAPSAVATARQARSGAPPPSMAHAEALAAAPAVAPAHADADQGSLIAQVASRETAARVMFSTAKSQALSEGRRQAAQARAESAGAIARLRETAAQPTQVLAQAAAHERARMQAAAYDSGHKIATASKQVEQANEAHALAAIAAQDIESTAEERGVRESVHAGRQAAGHQIDDFVLGTGAMVNRAAYDLAAAMEQAIAEAQEKTADGLTSVIDELTAAGEAIAAKIDAQTVAIIASLTTAEQRFMAGLAQVRVAAARTPDGNPAALASVDKSLGDLGQGLGEVAAHSLGSYEGLRGDANAQYNAVIAQLAATAWPQVGEARAQWAQQATDFIASADVATGDAVGRLLSLNAVLPARFMEIAHAAVADARRSLTDKIGDKLSAGAWALVEGIGVFVGAVLVLGAAIAIVLGAPFLAAAAVAAAIIGGALLIGGAVKAFIERIEALSQQWDDWSIWDKLGMIALSVPASFSDAAGFTGLAEGGTRRDSRTGAHLSKEEAIARAAGSLENITIAVLTGKAAESMRRPGVNPDVAPAELAPSEAATGKGATVDIAPENARLKEGEPSGGARSSEKPPHSAEPSAGRDAIDDRAELPPPTQEEIAAMHDASTAEGLKMAARFVQSPNTSYFHNVGPKGGARAIVESSAFEGGEGTASFGGGRAVRAWIGEAPQSPGSRRTTTTIEFTTDAPPPDVRPYMGTPGAKWNVDTLPVKIHKIYLADGRVLVPDGGGQFVATAPDGTVSHVGLSEIPE